MSHLPRQIQRHYQEAFSDEQEELQDTPILVAPSINEDDLLREGAQIRRDEERAQDEYMATFFGDEHFRDEDEGSHTAPRPRHTNTRSRQWEEAEEHARTPIYHGSRVNQLSAILLLLNLQARHKATNGLLDDVF